MYNNAVVNKLEKVSIVIPCFNEAKYLHEMIKKVLNADVLGLEKEIIIIDDASSDNSPDIITELSSSHKEITHILKKKNQGKGAALQSGFELCTGDIIIIQDSDLELNPDEYPDLLRPILDLGMDVVYGSRFLKLSHKAFNYKSYLANKFLTNLSNVFTNVRLTDIETCYKVFKRKVIDRHQFNSKRFGFEVEFTTVVSAMRLNIYEVPVTYFGRTYGEGKKIGFSDGVEAVFLIIWTNLFLKIYNK
ncbi:glycosyltransferase family 2 protein [bacterium]|nr:glycosyltransferase family 2 protein [bacterium]